MSFQVDDMVLIVSGPGEDEAGRIVAYDTSLAQYLIELASSYVFKFEEELEYAERVPETPEFGMSSDDTADYVEDFIRCSVERIRGIGQEQYSEGSYQQFEALTPPELLEMMQEELRDMAAYAAFNHIALGRIKEAMGAMFDTSEEDA